MIKKTYKIAKKKFNIQFQQKTHLSTVLPSSAELYRTLPPEWNDEELAAQPTIHFALYKMYGKMAQEDKRKNQCLTKGLGSKAN